MSPSDAMLLLSGIATEQGCELNASHPILETTFPLTGDRIEGMIRPVVSEAAFAIRTRSKQIYTLDDFAQQGVLSQSERPAQREMLSRGIPGSSLRRSFASHSACEPVPAKHPAGRSGWLG